MPKASQPSIYGNVTIKSCECQGVFFIRDSGAVEKVGFFVSTDNFFHKSFPCSKSIFANGSSPFSFAMVARVHLFGLNGR